MDNFIQELINIVKLPFDEINKDYKLIMLGSKTIFISNYKKILDYTQDRVVLKVYKDYLEINGRELFISLINKHELILKGEILSCVIGGKNEKTLQK